LRVFEDRELRRIFRPKREEVNRCLNTLHIEEFHNLHSSSNIIRVIKSKKDEIGGACSIHGRNAYNILVSKPEGK
jgi:hypothetical protein